MDARSFDLGYGRRFDLTSKGGNVKYFIGFAELVEYTSTFWQTVLVNQECPAPPPPHPPPPAQASVAANLQLSGTTAADFDAEAQDDFRSGVALYLNESKAAITINSFTDVTAPAGRRRRLQQSTQLSVQFTVNVRDFDVAQNVAQALTPPPSSGSGGSGSSVTSTFSADALVNSLYTMGMRTVQTVEVTAIPALAAPPLSPPSPPPSPPPPPTCGNGAFDSAVGE